MGDAGDHRLENAARTGERTSRIDRHEDQDCRQHGHYPGKETGYSLLHRTFAPVTVIRRTMCETARSVLADHPLHCQDGCAAPRKSSMADGWIIPRQPALDTAHSD